MKFSSVDEEFIFNLKFLEKAFGQGEALPKNFGSPFYLFQYGIIKRVVSKDYTHFKSFRYFSFKFLRRIKKEARRVPVVSMALLFPIWYMGLSVLFGHSFGGG